MLKIRSNTARKHTTTLKTEDAQILYLHNVTYRICICLSWVVEKVRPKLPLVGASSLTRKAATSYPHTFSSGWPKGISCPPQASICLLPSA